MPKLSVSITVIPLYFQVRRQCTFHEFRSVRIALSAISPASQAHEISIIMAIKPYGTKDGELEMAKLFRAIHVGPEKADDISSDSFCCFCRSLSRVTRNLVGYIATMNPESQPR